MSGSYFLDPAQRWFLSMENAKAERDQAVMELLASDPALRNNLVEYPAAFPQGSAELGLALAQGGIPAGDPNAQMAVNAEMQVRDNLGPIENAGGGWWNNVTGSFDEWVTNPIQGTVRWTFSAWDAAYQMVAGGAPIRARELAQQEGISYGDAWKEQDPFFFEALGGLFANERVNIGSGWFPNSDVTDEVSMSVNTQMQQLEVDTEGLQTNERYRARLEGAPDIWRQAVQEGGEAQAELGRPIVQQNYADTESVMFEINPAFANPDAGAYYTPWSPGRMVAAQVFEPGTTSFKTLSGTGDIIAQIFADPVDYLGMAWLKAGRNSRRMWGEAQGMAQEVVKETRVVKQKYASEAEAAGRVLGESSPTLGLPVPSTLSGETARLVGESRVYTGEGVRNVVQTPVYDEAGEFIRFDVEDIIDSSVLPGRGPYVPAEEGSSLPWWLSGDDLSERKLTPFDPPLSYVDRVRAAKQAATDAWRGTSAKVKRVIAGEYEMDVPRIAGRAQEKIKIRRVGEGKKSYWVIEMPDGSRLGKATADPRFDKVEGKYRTLDEAKGRLGSYMDGDEYQDALRVDGMTPDEFVATGETFQLDNPGSVIEATNPSAKNPTGRGVIHRVRHKKTKGAKGKLNNARVQVFGKTMDLSKMRPDELPQGLLDALKKDRKISGNDYQGFGNPNTEKFTNTSNWLEANGYGKLKWDEDVTLIVDSYIGGTGVSPDANSRMWFDAGDQPMYSFADDVTTATPNEVNEVLDFMSTSGGRVADEAAAPAAKEAATSGRIDRVLPEEYERALRAEIIEIEKILDLGRRPEGMSMDEYRALGARYSELSELADSAAKGKVHIPSRYSMSENGAQSVLDDLETYKPREAPARADSELKTSVMDELKGEAEAVRVESQSLFESAAAEMNLANDRIAEIADEIEPLTEAKAALGEEYAKALAAPAGAAPAPKGPRLPGQTGTWLDSEGPTKSSILKGLRDKINAIDDEMSKLSVEKRALYKAADDAKGRAEKYRTDAKVLERRIENSDFSGYASRVDSAYRDEGLLPRDYKDVEFGPDTVVDFDGKPLAKWEYDEKMPLIDKMIAHYEKTIAEAHAAGKRPLDSDVSGLAEQKLYKQGLDDAMSSGRPVSGMGSDPVPIKPAGEKAINPSEATVAEWSQMANDEWVEVYHATDVDTATAMMNDGITSKAKSTAGQTGDEVVRIGEQGKTGEGLYVGGNPNKLARMYVQETGQEGRQVVMRIFVRKGDLLLPREAGSARMRMSADGAQSDNLLSAFNAENIGAVVYGDIPPANIQFASRSDGMVNPSADNLGGIVDDLAARTNDALSRVEEASSAVYIASQSGDARAVAAADKAMAIARKEYSDLKAERKAGFGAADDVGTGFDIPSMGREVGKPVGGVPAGTAVDDITPAARKLADEKAAATAQKIADAPTPAEPPTFRGVRNDIDPTFQLHGKKADKFLDKLVAVSRTGGGKRSIAMLDELLSFFPDRGITVPVDVRTALYEAQTKNEIRDIFVKWLVTDGGQEVLLPGGTQYGRLATVTGGPRTQEGTRLPSFITTDRSGFKRRFTNSLPTKEEINFVDNPTKSYEVVIDALPHYNLSRGAEVKLYDPKTGELLAGTAKVEDVLERIRTMKPGDKATAYGVMSDLNKMLFSSLVGDGVSPELAARVSKWWDENLEMSNFSASRFGKIQMEKGVTDVLMTQEGLLPGLGPQLDASLWTGALKMPHPKELKRVANESDLLGKIANSISAKKVVTSEADGPLIGGMKFDDRVGLRVTTFAMNKVWKPFVLLRAAWTLRILMDDQARMLADGYSMFNHPMRIFNYALSKPEDWKNAFVKGRVDINGVSMITSKANELHYSDDFRAAMMRVYDDSTDIGTYGSRQFIDIKRGSDRYEKNLGFELRQLRGSLLTKQMAGAKGDAVKNTVRWLRGEAGGNEDQIAVQISSLAQIHGKTPDIAEKILALDEKTLTDVVSRQWAILHHTTGGDVVLNTGQGKLIDMDTLRFVGDTEPGGIARYEVRQDGDADLLKIISGDDELVGSLDEVANQQKLEKLLREKLRSSSKYPVTVRGPRDIIESGATKSLEKSLDDATGKLMDFFMTIPSNKLSRSVEFRNAYWERMAEFYPYMDDALRKQMDELAPLRVKGKLKEARKRDAGIRGQVTDMDQVDAQAKAFALTRVESTLFTLTSKKNISDTLNLVFPFVEAWGEFLSRWSRIMVKGDTNIRAARRFQQSVEGVRGSGFFYENEYGQEVFNYPAFMTKFGVGLHNTLNNLPVVGGALGDDVSPEVADSIQSTGSVESLNFASGVIPGFGPVFQQASKQLLPDDPAFDWVRDIVSPYGTSGGVVAQLSPAWFKRVLSATGSTDDPALQYTYNSTLMDIMRTKIDRGDFAGVTSQEEINVLVKEAEGEAKGLLMVRAAATFFEPASPQYKFQKEDKNGMIWSYSNLGAAFYDIQTNEAGGDTTAAFDIFYKRFGFLPQAFRVGKTYSVTNRSTSVSGGQFERGNSELFLKYPSTAMYVDPNIAGDSEYDHGAMLRQLQDGLRAQWTGEQFALKQQDQLGDLWWDNANKVAAAMSRPAAEQYLTVEREIIQSKYPAWNQPIPGKVQGTTSEQKMVEIDRMLADPSLAGSPAIKAARKYNFFREQVLVEIRSAGASTIDGPRSKDTLAGQLATAGREWLREQADELMIEYPEFSQLFSSVYSYEVSDVNDAPEPLSFEMFDGEDIFTDLGLSA